MNKGLEALKELDEKHGCFATDREYELFNIIKQELERKKIFPESRFEEDYEKINCKHKKVSILIDCNCQKRKEEFSTSQLLGCCQKDNCQYKEELEFRREHEAEDEFWLNKLYEENQILRNGIKALNMDKNYCDVIYLKAYKGNPIHGDSIERILTEDKTVDKIKKMLEVIENGN